jgi:hypothetical protein
MMTLRSWPDLRPMVVRRRAPQPRLFDAVQEATATESVERPMSAPGPVDHGGGCFGGRAAVLIADSSRELCPNIGRSSALARGGRADGQQNVPKTRRAAACPPIRRSGPAMQVSAQTPSTMHLWMGPPLAMVAAVGGGIGYYCGVIIDLAVVASARLMRDAGAHFVVTSFNSGTGQAFLYVNAPPFRRQTISGRGTGPPPGVPLMRPWWRRGCRAGTAGPRASTLVW